MAKELPELSEYQYGFRDKDVSVYRSKRGLSREVVEEISRDHAEQLTVGKLNIDDNPDTPRRYGVLSIPTLIVFKDGQEKARVVGDRGKEAILREIEPHFAA